MITTNTSVCLAGLMLVGFVIALPAHAAESPHWSKSTCKACHTQASPTVGSSDLVDDDIEALCGTCHGGRGSAIPCRHASAIPAGDTGVSDGLRPFLRDEQVVCTTCHDIVYQCEHAAPHYQFQNSGFLRNQTSYDSASYCFNCHDESAYEKLNPHLGIRPASANPTCLLCHEIQPQTSATGELTITFNMPNNLNDMCLGCHNSSPHPKRMVFGAAPQDQSQEWVHLVKPSEDVVKRLEETFARTGIELPLDPQTGEVFCATCHNPHEFKVGGEHGSQSRNPKRRLRLDNICQACHDK